MKPVRIAATLVCAYLTFVGLGILTGLDTRLLIGPTGSPLNRAVGPQLHSYLELTNPFFGATLLIVLGVVALVMTWRGAFKPQAAKKKGKG